jgi:uncharacterized protein (TIGR02145 family)
MKLTNILIATSLVLASSLASHAQVGIGTSSPNASAALEVTSTNTGFLPPRMTEAQRNNINAPATGLMVYCTNCGTDGELQVYNGSAWTNLVGGIATAAATPGVIGAGGKEWMDRNLGATQVATSSTDAASYGDYYQWGRRADGHQISNSGTTTILSSTDVPANSLFITNGSGNYDWRNPQNIGLWQGVTGINNPCPSGYRIPTEAEWNAERASWGNNNQNSAGAFASPLKLPVAGARSFSLGSLSLVGTYGNYWSSTVSSTSSRYLSFDSSDANMYYYNRASGCSVRCLKD